MPRMPSRGRQTIPIRLIENQDNMYTTFSKRRRGLYKKASELSTLCDADVGVTIFSPTNNPFSFWHPTMESVVERYRDPNQLPDYQTRVREAEARGRVENLNMQLDLILNENEILKQKEKQIDDELDQTREKCWWQEIPIESLSKDQVKEWSARFRDFTSKVQKCIDDKKRGSSSTAQHSNVAYFHGVAAGPSAVPRDFRFEPSYAQTMGMMAPYHLPSNYHNFPHPHLPLARGGTSRVPSQYPSGILNHFKGVGEPFARDEAGEPSTSRGVGEPETHGEFFKARPSYRGDDHS